MRNLNRVGIFEYWEIEGGAASASTVGVEDDASVLPAFVEVAIVVAHQCGRFALGAVDFDMFATGNAIGIKGHKQAPSPSPLIYWNHRRGTRVEIFELKGSYGGS